MNEGSKYVELSDISANSSDRFVLELTFLELLLTSLFWNHQLLTIEERNLFFALEGYACQSLSLFVLLFLISTVSTPELGVEIHKGKIY